MPRPVAQPVLRTTLCALVALLSVFSSYTARGVQMLPSSLPNAVVGQPYAAQFLLVPAQFNTNWSITPACLNGSGLGFAQVGRSGLLSGTPTTPGSYSCVVTANYVVGGDPSISQPYVLNVVPACVAPSITSAPPPPATAGVPYAYTVTASGTPPFAFAASGLPPGLTIDPASGLISGTPTSTGSFTGTITVSGCGGATTAQTFTQVVNVNPVTITLTSTPNPAFFPQAVVATATVTDGSVPVSGSVQLCVLVPGQFCAPPVGSPPPGTDPGLIPPLLSAPLGSNGQATFNLNGLTIQTYTLRAYYPGDASHAAALSDMLDQFVIKGILLPPPAVALLAPPQAAAGEAVPVRVVVTPVAAGATPTGQVRLYAAAVATATATLDRTGSAQLQITASRAGMLSLHADYSGDMEFPPAASQQVDVEIVAKDGIVNAIPALSAPALAVLVLMLAALGAVARHRRAPRR